VKYITKIKQAPIGVKLSGVFLLIVLLWVLIPDILVPDALSQDLSRSNLAAGSPGHILGTDVLGRDVFSMLIAGARSAMIGPLCIAVGSLLIGVFLGSLAGWYGGITDRIISSYADLTLSMPSMLLAIVAAGIIGGGYWVSVLVMIILYSPFDVRLVRSAVIVQKSKPYIESAMILRIKTMRILIWHIFPNIAMLIMVNFFLNIAYGLVSMSSLSFLGLGVGPGEADWGRLLADGRQFLFTNPAQAVGAGLLIILAAVSINLIGNYAMEKGELNEI